MGGDRVSVWNESDTLVPNAPLVVSETLNGEAIIMHHGNGHYFDAVHSGALLWEAIECGATVPALVARLEAAYGIGSGEAAPAVARFLSVLAAHDLIRAGEVRTAPPVATPAAEPFVDPVLGVHTDLADMLMLDPVHDVDEAGWPAPKQAAGGAR